MQTIEERDYIEGFGSTVKELMDVLVDGFVH